jgi:hypothetical protein
MVQVETGSETNMNEFVSFTFQKVLDRDACGFRNDASDIVACNAVMQH